MRSRAASAAVSTLVLAIALSACTKSASTSSTTSSPAAPSPAASSISTAPSMAGDLATFTSTSPAYSFRYPSSWAKEEGTSSHPVTLSPESGPNWVELTLDKVRSGTTLDAYRQVYRKQVAQWGFTVVATHPATMGGQPALVIESTKMTGPLSRTAAFFTISGDYVYMLTLNGPDDPFDADYFDTDYRTVVSMAESFGFGG